MKNARWNGMFGVAALVLAAGMTFGEETKARYAVSDSARAEDEEIFWPGFLNGLRGFEHFYEPVGQPIYFESPFNNSQVRALFLHHTFADGSQLQGGHVNVYAVQARLALTERLGFIATKDGYSELSTGALGDDSGWNSVAAGFKYVAYMDREEDFVVTPGIRLMLNSGEAKVLQSGVTEISPFVSVAKGWDEFHMIGNLTYRLPTDGDKGNDILQWDLHADYEVAPGFAPLVELHGLHYLTDATAAPFSVGGLDYTNLGSADVSGSTVIWMEVGGRVKFCPHTSLGATYGIALTNRNADIMDQRVTIDFILSW